MEANLKKYQADIAIIGGGISGLACACELIKTGKKILIIERDNQEKLGGNARKALGNIMAVDTPIQRKYGIRDSYELAMKDWHKRAEFKEGSHFQQEWARKYIEYSNKSIFEWLVNKGVEFLPIAVWNERGMLNPVNSLPRSHIVLGAGPGVITPLLTYLEGHENSDNLEFKFRHRVNSIKLKDKRVSGLSGIIESTHSPFEIDAEIVIACSGGTTASEFSTEIDSSALDKKDYSLYNSSRFNDGTIHSAIKDAGGIINNLDQKWLYPLAIKHPDSLTKNYGLNLLPSKSALWVNHKGERIGPVPLMGNTDNRFLTDQITNQKGKFTWQIMNMKIAQRELSIHGSDYMDSLRNKDKLKLLMEYIFGNRKLINRLIKESDDIIAANSIESLVEKINLGQPEFKMDVKILKEEIREFDQRISLGKKFVTDQQLRRVYTNRKYIPDFLTTSNFQKISDKYGFPLIAVKGSILAGPNLGGVVTDLKSRVMDSSLKPIPGLYAAGETAGFGGGGIHGKACLEGTFLGACILTAHAASENIISNI